VPGAVAEIGALPTIYRVRRPSPDPAVPVTLIVPTRDGYGLLRQCVESLARTTYTNRELIVVDNQSSDPRTLDYLRELRESGAARVLPFDRPFNYSALNNLAVREANGQVICLLNNDVEVIAPDWLSEMVAHALRPEVGAVGAKLRYPDGSLQHAGVVVGLGGVAGHGQRSLPRDAPGYQWQAQVTRNVSAVTAACLAIRKEVYLAVAGLDERLAVAFNDVDFCLRLREAGYLNVWTPYAELYHHESKTRGTDDTPEKKARFRSEFALMKQRWGARLSDDPFYSPNLTVETEDFSLAWPPRVRKPWLER
jgi:GT2 family glycosyltransferase